MDEIFCRSRTRHKEPTGHSKNWQRELSKVMLVSSRESLSLPGPPSLSSSISSSTDDTAVVDDDDDGDEVDGLLLEDSSAH